MELCVIDTKYDVIKDVGLSLNYRINSEENDNKWDLYWTDSAVQPE